MVIINNTISNMLLAYLRDASADVGAASPTSVTTHRLGAAQISVRSNIGFVEVNRAPSRSEAAACQCHDSEHHNRVDGDQTVLADGDFSSFSCRQSVEMILGLVLVFTAVWNGASSGPSGTYDEVPMNTFTRFGSPWYPSGFAGGLADAEASPGSSARTRGGIGG